MLKSATAVLLCTISGVLFSFPTGNTTFYRALAALWCIQPFATGSRKNAAQRIAGTLIGAVIGLVTTLIVDYLLPENHPYLEAIIIGVMTIPTLYLAVLFRRPNASFFACSVFLSIALMTRVDTSPFLFAGERLIDTLIGIIVGVIVSEARLPRRRQYGTLYLANFDHALLHQKQSPSPQSAYELKRMQSDGLQLTLYTSATPATLMESLGSITLTLPVIAMDGAVLYDTQQKKYLRSYVISYEKTVELVRYIRSHDMQCFINAVIDDTLIIYHDVPKSPAERDMFDKLYSSPHRNYLSMELPEHTPCIYVMTLNTTERIDALYRGLTEQGYAAHLKILHYASDDYIGYSYLKIYSKNAEPENLLPSLLELSNCTTTDFLTLTPTAQDTAELSTLDDATRYLRHHFEPIGLPTKGHRIHKK